MRVECLAKEHNAVFRQGSNPGRSTRRSSALTISPPRLLSTENTPGYLGHHPRSVSSGEGVVSEQKWCKQLREAEKYKDKQKGWITVSPSKLTLRSFDSMVDVIMLLPAEFCTLYSSGLLGGNTALASFRSQHNGPHSVKGSCHFDLFWILQVSYVWFTEDFP